MPVIQALGMYRKEYRKFKVVLSYIANSTPAHMRSCFRMK